jgi:hypothetical protein
MGTSLVKLYCGDLLTGKERSPLINNPLLALEFRLLEALPEKWYSHLNIDKFPQNDEITLKVVEALLATSRLYLENGIIPDKQPELNKLTDILDSIRFGLKGYKDDQRMLEAVLQERPLSSSSESICRIGIINKTLQDLPTPNEISFSSFGHPTSAVVMPNAILQPLKVDFFRLDKNPVTSKKGEFSTAFDAGISRQSESALGTWGIVRVNSSEVKSTMFSCSLSNIDPKTGSNLPLKDLIPQDIKTSLYQTKTISNKQDVTGNVAYLQIPAESNTDYMNIPAPPLTKILCAKIPNCDEPLEVTQNFLGECSIKVPDSIRKGSKFEVSVYFGKLTPEEEQEVLKRHYDAVKEIECASFALSDIDKRILYEALHDKEPYGRLKQSLENMLEFTSYGVPEPIATELKDIDPDGQINRLSELSLVGYHTCASASGYVIIMHQALSQLLAESSNTVILQAGGYQLVDKDSSQVFTEEPHSQCYIIAKQGGQYKFEVFDATEYFVENRGAEPKSINGLQSPDSFTGLFLERIHDLINVKVDAHKPPLFGVGFIKISVSDYLEKISATKDSGELFLSAEGLALTICANIKEYENPEGALPKHYNKEQINDEFFDPFYKIFKTWPLDQKVLFISGLQSGLENIKRFLFDTVNSADSDIDLRLFTEKALFKTKLINALLRSPLDFSYNSRWLADCYNFAKKLDQDIFLTRYYKNLVPYIKTPEGLNFVSSFHNEGSQVLKDILISNFRISGSNLNGFLQKELQAYVSETSLSSIFESCENALSKNPNFNNIFSLCEALFFVLDESHPLKKQWDKKVAEYFFDRLNSEYDGVLCIPEKLASVEGAVFFSQVLKTFNLKNDPKFQEFGYDKGIQVLEEFISSYSNAYTQSVSEQEVTTSLEAIIKRLPATAPQLIPDQELFTTTFAKFTDHSNLAALVTTWLKLANDTKVKISSVEQKEGIFESIIEQFKLADYRLVHAWAIRNKDSLEQIKSSFQGRASNDETLDESSIEALIKRYDPKYNRLLPHMPHPICVLQYLSLLEEIDSLFKLVNYKNNPDALQEQWHTNFSEKNHSFQSVERALFDSSVKLELPSFKNVASALNSHANTKKGFASSSRSGDPRLLAPGEPLDLRTIDFSTSARVNDIVIRQSPSLKPSKVAILLDAKCIFDALYFMPDSKRDPGKPIKKEFFASNIAKLCEPIFDELSKGNIVELTILTAGYPQKISFKPNQSLASTLNLLHQTFEESVNLYYGMLQTLEFSFSHRGSGAEYHLKAQSADNKIVLLANQNEQESLSKYSRRGVKVSLIGE